MELQFEVLDWLGMQGWVEVRGDKLGQEEVGAKEVGGEEERQEEVGVEGGGVADAGEVEDAGVN